MAPRGGRILIAIRFLGAGLFAVMTALGVQAKQRGDCGDPAINVVYDQPYDLVMACEALADVIAYFRRIGFDISPEVSVDFRDRPLDRSTGQGASHGYFAARRTQITAYRLSDAHPWGVPWTAQLAASFLRHELAHVAIWDIASDYLTPLRPEWHEFIAYAVQIELMGPELRNDILAANERVQAFESFGEVNEFTSRMNPEVFAIAAYKTYVAKGKGKFIAQLLRAETVPPPFYYPFYTLPGQVPNK